MNIQEIEPSKLALDLRNPRFGLSEAASEPDALGILFETADLKELWNSIAERGFEPYEPLVATNENGALVVLEGNRRLAAVKLLLEPELLENERLRKRIPSVESSKLDTCRTLPVLIVDNRDEAAGYIGFKHVNGPTRWSSLAKAKFGVNFYESLNQHLSPQARLQSLTKQLGDSRGLIIRLLVAYKIILQSVKLGLFEKLDIDESTIEFSHLYTLINNPESRDFIGLKRAPLNEGLIIDDPVPETHQRELLELLDWLYGPKSIIKSQGTDRPRLQRVLASEEGLSELRLTGNLNNAEAVAGLRTEDWLEALAKIQSLTQRASGDVAAIVDEVSEEDSAQAQSLLKRIRTHIRQIESAFNADP